jgi:aldehyde dehydrogenase (NAD+)
MNSVEVGTGAAPSDEIREAAAAVHAELRSAFRERVTRPTSWRQDQLKGLRALLKERERDLLDALYSDLRKPHIEGYATEVAFCNKEIDHTLRHLHSWLRPEQARVPILARPARAWVIREPLGVALIIAPWNYPVMLTIAPLIGALAAGNCAVVKPSELAPAVADALADLVPRYLDRRCVRVVNGGVAETTVILDQPWDHVLYTGNGSIGRVVMTAAAKHLTPVTLELGGKNPVIVDADADVRLAARRIAWGRFLNSGQSCVAPDYVLAHREVYAPLLLALAEAVRTFYGTDPRQSADFGRIVNERHFQRLAALLGEGRVVVGGQVDPADRYIAPTILADVNPEAPVMQEEIFGPILPVLPVDDLGSAIAFVNSRPKPLSVYVFTASKTVQERVIAETSSGAVGVGVPAFHMAVPELPFGGVGASGMGPYHGRWGIETFSHRKAVLDRSRGPDVMSVIYPPYTALKRKLMHWLL